MANTMKAVMTSWEFKSKETEKIVKKDFNDLVDEEMFRKRKPKKETEENE